MQVAQILKEKGFASTEMVQSNAEIGKLLNVQALVVGKASLYSVMGGLGGGAYCSARLIDVETGSVIWTFNMKRWKMFTSPSTVAGTELTNALNAIYSN